MFVAINNAKIQMCSNFDSLDLLPCTQTFTLSVSKKLLYWLYVPHKCEWGFTQWKADVISHAHYLTKKNSICFGLHSSFGHSENNRREVTHIYHWLPISALHQCVHLAMCIVYLFMTYLTVSSLWVANRTCSLLPVPSPCTRCSNSSDTL